jgi:FKBP-type peptidyl-prolyl cis-trans isomerase 2
MAPAKDGDTVKVHYTGKLGDGTIFDSSEQNGPVQFTIGENQVIGGFERAIIGMSPGEKKTAEVEAEDAYGPRRDDAVMEVDRSQLPDDLDPDVGDQLQAQRRDGDPVVVTVTDVSDSSVTLDANHPLAGRDLTFDIELVEITGS